MKKSRKRNLSTVVSSPVPVGKSSKRLYKNSSFKTTEVGSPGYATEGFRRTKGIYGPLDSSTIPDLRDPLKFDGSKVRYIEVELLADVEFMTHSRTYHFAKGVQSIPLDLAKMMFRLQKARPVLPVKTVPATKQGRY